MTAKNDKVAHLSVPTVSPLQEHFRGNVNSIFKSESPVKGYALVTFHENGGYCTAFHTADIPLHQLDMPEAVKVRLAHSASKL
jgi:hypothetical protein